VPAASDLGAAPGAIVTAARVGRLLGRSGWRRARQLPGGRTIERETQRLQSYALGELRRVLDIQNAVRDNFTGRASSGDEERAVALIQNTDPGESPLRAAMGELLARSADADPITSNEYLFGTIISQLVPDEARLIAALAGGARFAALDVIARRRTRLEPTVLLANASTVGRAAGLAELEQVPTYLTRLRGFGLVEFGPGDAALASEYDLLHADPAVRAAQAAAALRAGSARTIQKTVRLSMLGRQFWQACAPAEPDRSRSALPYR
jgi:hypothetical protein